MIDKNQMQAFLPHRDPFFFLDRVTSLTLPGGDEWTPASPAPPEGATGTRVVASWRVDPGLPMLRGHFPGNPVLPGVIQAEAMSQAAAMALWPRFHAERGGAPGGRTFHITLLSMRNAKFRTYVRPPAVLTVQAEITREKGDMLLAECRILNPEGTVMSETSIMGAVRRERPIPLSA